MPKNDFSKFLELIRPNKTFDETLHPPSPDYSIDYNWAAKPNINGQQFYVPDNSYEVNKSNDVDVFLYSSNRIF